MPRGLAPFACFVFVLMAAPGLLAQAGGAPGETAAAGPAPPQVRTDTPSGFPVPRFVSLKSGATYCRLGPTFEHPVRFTYQRKGLPAMVVAETTNHWRKIRDADGEECWVHKTKLSGERTVVVVEEGLILRAAPSRDAIAQARLAAGVIARLGPKSGDWRRIDAGDGVRGWVPAQGLWGAVLFDAATPARD